MHAFSLRWGPAAASVLVGGLLLAFPGAASRGAASGLALCLNTAVPSLFPFMVLAVYVSASGAGEDLGRLLRRPVQWLGLPAQTTSAVLLAFLGGYPAGAAGISQLLREEKLTRPQAQRAMALCCLPSPVPPPRVCLCWRTGALAVSERRAGLKYLCSSILKL